MTLTGEEIPAIPDVLVENTEIRDLLLALKQVTEIRNGRRGDKGQRFITYYELIDYLQGNDKITVEAVTGGHNHDTLYYRQTSLYTRTEQDARYLKITDAEGQYALLKHHHNGLYALTDHVHQDTEIQLAENRIHHHDDHYSMLGHPHEDMEASLANRFHHHDDLYPRIGPQEWYKYTANGITLNNYSSSSALSDLQTAHDGNFYTANESAGNAGQNIVIDFANVIHFSRVNVLARYQGQNTHVIAVEIEASPFDGSTWHTYDSFTDQVADAAMENHGFFLFDDDRYINNGVVKVRMAHPVSGVSGHTIVIDVVSLHFQEH